MPSNVNPAKLFLIEASLAANDLENVSVSVGTAQRHIRRHAFDSRFQHCPMESSPMCFSKLLEDHQIDHLPSRGFVRWCP